MAGFGNTYKKGISDFIFRLTAFQGVTSTTTSVYVSLHTGDPGPDGASASSNEVSTTSTGYARTQINLSTNPFTAATVANPSVTSNSAAVTFPTAVTTNWGTITHFGIWTSSTLQTAATFVGGQALTASQVVNVGNTASFAVGALVHNFTG